MKNFAFKDFYEKNQLELSQSIKLLIEKVLLTNNLLEFFLMRLKSKKKHNFFSDQLVQFYQIVQNLKKENIKEKSRRF